MAVLRMLRSWLRAFSRRAGGRDGRLMSLPLHRIRENPAQPRTFLEPKAFDRLQASIRAYGVITPIVVRPVDEGYELVAGQRRLRACRELEMTAIPAIVRDLTAAEAAEISLLENLQREKLATVEAARAFRRVAKDSPGRPIDALARTLGRPDVEAAQDAELLRLDSLLQEAEITGVLSVEEAMRIHRSGENPVAALVKRRRVS